MRRVFLAASLAAFVCLLLGDPGATQTKRTVNVYNWSDYIEPTLVDQFTQGDRDRRPLRHVRFQ